ncbi:hypothetical protein MVI01_75360 [Myxococcus virescens]|uniref:Uncharacterized protein n=1 Tax=Myxococcus virescens TaxID=83456 RepID=A0A511HQ86_9BACT|nr:hypothetical protein MVI01_75360 [Myxococcus virescens]
MKAYGINRKDRSICRWGCCPSHGRYPTKSYCGRLSRKVHVRGTRLAHRRARAQARAALFNERRNASRSDNEK